MIEDDKIRNEGQDNYSIEDELDWLRAQNERIFAENTQNQNEIDGDGFGGESIKGMRPRQEDAIGFAESSDGSKRIFGLGDGFAGGGPIAKYVVVKALEGTKSFYDCRTDHAGDTQEIEVALLDDQNTPQADMDTEDDWLEVEESADWRSVPFLERIRNQNMLHIEGVITNDVLVVALAMRDVLVQIQNDLFSKVGEMIKSGANDGLWMEKSGSTHVLVVNDSEAEALTIVWNGDSGVYGVTDDNEIVKLTCDHVPTSKDPKHKNSVFNVFVAMEETIFEPEILILGGEEYKKYKYYVLVTDGVWSQGVNPEKVISDATRDDGLSEKEMARKIVIGAFEDGSSDNISAIVVRR